ncbi:relaxase/mobilization nuclease domain-containing protein [Pontibacter silvestris]|uniref:Relaxase/mobilization nuclease domain-containing protein n=1 Tax=Pontibacter silvestris TaxID=2305183 RepID=A0ABW4WXN2_9BACT|nr:relaxase/mobilization nuclease domain-containing protein [Pontibacter silvestris]MCC9138866.1 relaxase/mobilization nuclease domain-containing protein [Pontibacter silvestris]
MIATPVRGNDFRGIFDYHEKKVREGVAREIGRSENLEGLDKGGLIEDFNLNVEQHISAQTKGRKLERFTFHPHLDFAKEDFDKLSDELLHEIAMRYMKAMGYGDCEYVLYRHEDREHPHIHIVSSVIDKNGNRVANNKEKEKSFQICRALEKEYGFVIATDRSRVMEQEFERHKEEVGKIREGKIDELNLNFEYGAKLLINRAVNAAFSHPDIFTFEDFEKRLRQEGVKVLEVEKEGKVIGLRYAVNENTKGKSPFSVKASETEKRATLGKLEELFKKNDLLKKASVCTLVDQAIRRGAASFVSLRDQLALDGVRLLLHENKGGVYGLSFEQDGRVYKGSELKGKGYSVHEISQRLAANQPGYEKSLEELKKLIRASIDKAVKEQKVFNLATLKNALLLDGITLLEAKNSGGVYGLSFEKEGKVFKGSDLNEGYNKQYSFKGIMASLQKNDPAHVVKTAYSSISKHTDALGTLVQLHAMGISFSKGYFNPEGFQKGVPIAHVMEDSHIRDFQNVDGAAKVFFDEKLTKKERELILAVFTIDNPAATSLEVLEAETNALLLISKGTMLKLPAGVKESFGKRAMKIISLGDSMKPATPTPLMQRTTDSPKGTSIAKTIQGLAGQIGDAGSMKKKKKKKDEEDEGYYHSL